MAAGSRASLVAGALLLSACSTLHGVDGPACRDFPTDADGRPQVTIFYATNREPTGDEGGVPAFGFGRVDAVTFGRARVSIPRRGARSLGSIRDFLIVAAEPIPTPARFAATLATQSRARRPRRRDALVYIHGYNNSFERSVFRAAQFVHDGCLPVVPVVFSWPSRGAPLDHNYDVDSATFSRGPAAELLRLVRDRSGFDRTHVMAHSMGNWIALEAMARLGASRGPPPRGRIGAAILASPDVDLDVFRRVLPAARPSADLVALLVSRRDNILRLSSLLAHARRAGNASREELARHGVVNQGNFRVIRMDDPEIGSCPAGGHRCAAANEKILQEIATLLERSGEPDADDGGPIAAIGVIPASLGITGARARP